MNPPPAPEPALSPAKPMPLLARMLNVFAVPGEVFDDVKVSPHAPASWLVPILIACLVGSVAALILYSQPAVVAQARHIMERQMERQRDTLQRQVEDGKISQARSEEMVKGMQKVVETMTRPGMLKTVNLVRGILLGCGSVFWWAFALWLMALVFIRTRIPYLKALEVTGLASLIGTLGTIVTLLLQVNLGRSTATPSLALAVSDFDPANKMHLVMGALNLVQVWMVLIMGLGFARLTQVPFARAGLLVIAFYFLQTSFLVFMGAGLGML